MRPRGRCFAKGPSSLDATAVSPSDAADPEAGFAIAAAAELRAHGVEVGDGGIALTPGAAALYQAGPGASDTPVDEIFDLGDKRL